MPSLEPRRALILGEDFIAAALARRLIAEGVETVLAQARESRLDELVAGRDAVFNLAGSSSHLFSMREPRADLEANAAAQLDILEACRRSNPGARIVYASTRQLYGRPRALPVDESHPIEPVDVNGIHKRVGESYHLLYGRAHGLKATVLRLTNTYGPGMDMGSPDGPFLGAWFGSLLRGEELRVFGNGEQVRDLNYVDDVVAAFLLAARSERAVGEVYNLGCRPPVTLKELAGRMVRVNGSGSWRLAPFPRDRASIDIGDYHADYGKITRELGWRPGVPLDEGLRRTLDFYRAQHPLPRPEPSRAEPQVRTAPALG